MEEDIERIARSEAEALNLLKGMIAIAEMRENEQLDITLYTLCDGASVKISKTYAKRWVKDSWATMLRRYDPKPDFIESVEPTMEFELTKWNTLRLSAKLKTVRTDKNLAYLAEVKKARDEIYAEHYGVDEE